MNVKDAKKGEGAIALNNAERAALPFDDGKPSGYPGGKDWGR